MVVVARKGDCHVVTRYGLEVQRQVPDRRAWLFHTLLTLQLRSLFKQVCHTRIIINI